MKGLVMEGLLVSGFGVTNGKEPTPFLPQADTCSALGPRFPVTGWCFWRTGLGFTWAVFWSAGKGALSPGRAVPHGEAANAGPRASGSRSGLQKSPPWPSVHGSSGHLSAQVLLTAARTEKHQCRKQASKPGFVSPAKGSRLVCSPLSRFSSERAAAGPEFLTRLRSQLADLQGEQLQRRKDICSIVNVFTTRPKAKARDPGGVEAAFRCARAAAFGSQPCQLKPRRAVDADGETVSRNFRLGTRAPSRASKPRAGARVGGVLRFRLDTLCWLPWLRRHQGHMDSLGSAWARWSPSGGSAAHERRL